MHDIFFGNYALGLGLRTIISSRNRGLMVDPKCLPAYLEVILLRMSSKIGEKGIVNCRIRLRGQFTVHIPI
jgi:hypothetical protein